MIKKLYIKENDYSETDEFTLIKEMNHWIRDLKSFFVDDKKAQKAIADYFYYDDGAHQEDFKELQASVKTLHKLWLKLDDIVEEAEEKEYNKSKKESCKFNEGMNNTTKRLDDIWNHTDSVEQFLDFVFDEFPRTKADLVVDYLVDYQDCDQGDAIYMVKSHLYD